MVSTHLNTITPRKSNMEPENTPGKGKTCSEPLFSGVMLIFRGVIELDNFPSNLRGEHSKKIETTT